MFEKGDSSNSKKQTYHKKGVLPVTTLPVTKLWSFI